MTDESRWRGTPRSQPDDEPTNRARLTTATAPTIVPTTSTARMGILEWRVINLSVPELDTTSFSPGSSGCPSSVSMPMRGRYWNSNLVDSPMPPIFLLWIMKCAKLLNFCYTASATLAPLVSYFLSPDAGSRGKETTHLNDRSQIRTGGGETGC